MAEGVQVGTGYIDIRPDMSGFGRAMRADLSRDAMAAGAASGKGFLSGFTTSMRGMAGSIPLIGAGTILGTQVVDFFGGAITAASDLSETISKSTAVFGESAAAIEQWASGAADDFGLSKRGALEAAAGFGNMFSQLGLSSDQASGMSQSLVELAADFRSLNGGDITQVLEAQAAAFRGEYDSLQRFLPLINAATVEQRALQMTGKATTKELTAQEKALAANALMFEGAGVALGDYDRTSDSLANQQQKLTAQWEDMRTELGEALLPVVTDFFGVFNDVGLPVLKAAVGFADEVVDAWKDMQAWIAGSIQVILRAAATASDLIPLGWGDDRARELRSAADGMDDFRDSWHASREELTGWADGAGVMAAAAEALGAAIRGTPIPLDLLTDAVQANEEAVRGAGQAQRELQRAQWAYTELLQQTAVDEQAVADAREAVADASRSAAQADRQLSEAQERYDAALANSNDLKGWDTAQDELADAALGLADAQDSAADAHERAAKSEQELRDAQAGDPDYQNKLADARDRVAVATDKIAEATEKVGETAAQILTPVTQLTNALSQLGALGGGFVGATSQQAGSEQAGRALWAQTPNAPLNTADWAPAPNVNKVPAPAATVVNNKNVTVNVTQKNPTPWEIAREMAWALN